MPPVGSQESWLVTRRIVTDVVDNYKGTLCRLAVRASLDVMGSAEIERVLPQIPVALDQSETGFGRPAEG